MHIICYGYTLCCSFSFTSKICNEDIFENEKVSSYFLRECSERVTWRRGEKGQRTHGKVRCKAILKENGSTMKIDWSSHKICWRMLQSSFMFLKEEKVQVLWCLFWSRLTGWWCGWVSLFWIPSCRVFSVYLHVVVVFTLHHAQRQQVLSWKMFGKTICI